MAHIMTTIMRAFGAYDIPKILNTPFCHILKIYDMAERAIRLSQYDQVIAGYAPNSPEILHSLQQTARGATVPDKEIMKELLSQANRKLAEDAWRKMITKE